MMQLSGNYCIDACCQAPQIWSECVQLFLQFGGSVLVFDILRCLSFFILIRSLEKSLPL